MITEPAFYAVAVPAVLLMGLSKSGFGAGFGALAVPLMALAVPVPQAAAILLPLLLVMDLLGVAALVRHADWTLLRRLLPAGLVGTVLGTALFRGLSPTVVAGVVGAVTLVFVALRLLPRTRRAAPPPSWLGGVLATISGFTSFVAHAGGPPIGVYLLPLGLQPLVFTATLAVFFAVVNLSKWIPYAWLGLLDFGNFATSLVLVPLVPFGVWLGVHVARRISRLWFERIFVLGMTLTGAKLLYDGLAAP
ncbi:MAG TPA: sulfite exporter TauE/SafE family protein [Rubrivivax sp.]|nr:sulfite exporter TauE/SafE family protein [Rubrivivax sp.]